MPFDPISYALAKRNKPSPSVVKSKTPPSNTDVLWFDTSNNLLKYYNDTTSSWETIPDIASIRKLIISLG